MEQVYLHVHHQGHLVVVLHVSNGTIIEKIPDGWVEALDTHFGSTSVVLNFRSIISNEMVVIIMPHAAIHRSIAAPPPRIRRKDGTFVFEITLHMYSFYKHMFCSFKMASTIKTVVAQLERNELLKNVLLVFRSPLILVVGKMGKVHKRQ